MPLHASPHPLAGRRVRIEAGRYEGTVGTLTDWYDRVAGRSWTDSPIADQALAFAFRSAYERTPVDDDVVLVRVGSGLMLFHMEQVATLGTEPAPPALIDANEARA